MIQVGFVERRCAVEGMHAKFQNAFFELFAGCNAMPMRARALSLRERSLWFLSALTGAAGRPNPAAD
jgi:hypothetical protein